MAEEIAVGIAAKLLSSLGSSAIEQIGLAWGVKEELERLRKIVSFIKGIFLDAKHLQMSNSVVRYWLQRLQDILYDVDDWLDEVATETKRRELETHKRLVRKVRYFFTPSNRLQFRRKLGSEIKDIFKRLRKINSQGIELILNQVKWPNETIRREESQETSSLVNTRRIIGRKNDIEAFVSLLLSEEENVLTIPIVGIGGIGKTTLAQLVYNDYRVKAEFPKRLWVCVSTDFNIEQLLIKILQAGRKWDNSCSNKGFHEWKNQVTSMLSANKFLLFLDDVWIEDIVKWKGLMDLLIRGASGSRIVVTTRSMIVASIVKTSIVEPFRLRSLSEVECLALLVKLAFKEGEENMHENLVNIGREIVKKCEGIPLAVVTLGSLLFSKRVVQDWLFVRDNEMWGQTQGEIGILSVLRLSYDQMPSHLKQCFAYCSLFERGEIIDGKKLLYAWIAQGLVQHEGNCEIEHIGERYILELVNMFFLEPYGRQTIREHYKMHGLVHSLAKAVAGDECMTITGAVTGAIPKTLRHVAFDSKTYSEFPRPLMKAKKLRTLFYPRKKNPTSESSVETKSTSFRCLRVCAIEDMMSLPIKIRKLKLLRYLSLNGVDNLPKSLCKLLNLQYLDLSLSGDLEFPKDFEKLIDLQFLCLSTKSARLPTKGIGMLKSLRTLIISECEALWSLDDEIGQLSCLRELALESCSKLRFLPVGFRNLTSLERLEISSCLKLQLSNDDDLERLTSLRQLKLTNLPRLVSLPEGLLDAAGTLTHLEIESCMDFTSPSESVLPKLKSLKSLKIWDCENVDSLPEGMQRLTSLQSLSIVGCPLFTTKYEERAAESQKIAHVPEVEVKDRLSI